MPPYGPVLYEFGCDKCGRFSRREKLSAKSTPCPTCGNPAHRLYSSSFSIHYVPSYNEALAETQDLMDRGKI